MNETQIKEILNKYDHHWSMKVKAQIEKWFADGSNFPLAGTLRASELWNKALGELQTQFELEISITSERQLRRRLNEYYLPVFFWVVAVLEIEVNKRPLIIGLNAPQGSGKTTLTTLLVHLLKTVGIESLTLSIDDFYWTRKEQIELAQTHRENPYLQDRGNPGTHDIRLGETVLSELVCFSRGQIADKPRVPRYDKSLHQGQGDRVPSSQWSVIEKAPRLIFLEGWMLGFKKVDDLSKAPAGFEAINNFLPNYDAWLKFLDAFIILTPKNINDVVGWRIGAEERMKQLGKPGMSTQEIETYIKKFIPTYEVYSSGLKENPPRVGHLLNLDIGSDRLPQWLGPVSD